jgi:formyl-CoA transferase
MFLADLGAEVIKIEQLGGELTRKTFVVNGSSIYFSSYNRGKKSLCMDLRKPEAKDLFLELLKTSDCVLENFRPGTMEAMGLGYDRLCAVKPDIIMVRVSAFGQAGANRLKGGYDPIGQALSGLMTLTGQPEGKPIGTAFSLVDRITALNATSGTLAALHHRDHTGRGQVVETCLMDAAATTVEIPSVQYLKTGKEGGEGGRPPYRAKDGWVVISGYTPAMQARICELLGEPLPASDADPMASLNSDDSMRAMVHRWCAENTAEEICRVLEELNIPAAPVRTIPQAVEDPQLWEREMLVKARDHDGSETYVPGLSVKFSDAPGHVGDVPAPGEHSDDLLKEILGYSDRHVARLRNDRVIG